MSVTDPLVTLAPQRVVDHGLLGSDEVLTQDATTLFVDLSGFTGLVERLGAEGSRGTERLSDLLHAFFGAVTDTVTDAGGDLLAFGGDAITAVFDGPATQTLAAATLTAEAIEKLAVAESSTGAASDVALRTRIGIARGEVATAVARSAHRSVPVHLGTGLDLAVAAQAKAEVGHHVVDPSVDVGSRSGAAYSTLVQALPEPGDLARLASAPTVDRLRAGMPPLQSHRRVSVAFVRFPAVNADDLPAFLPTVGSMLDRVDAWEGEVVQVSGGDKGTVAMVVFGAPLAHADDPLRTIEAMLRLREDVPDVAVGVASGPVYAGLLGSRRRLLPTHVGLTVNTAARLMEAARTGDLLVEGGAWPEVKHMVRRKGHQRRLDLKGRRGSVDVHAVAGWRPSRRRRSVERYPPLVGRDAELAVVETFLDGLAESRGGLLEVVGVSGIGKTRLAQEAMDRARTREFAVVGVDTADHPRGQAQGLWRELLAGAIGLSAGAKTRDWRTALVRVLPESGDQLGVLEPILGIGLESSIGPRAQEELGLELARGLFADALEAAASDRSLLLVIDNADRLGTEDAQVVTALSTMLAESRVGVLTTHGRAREPGDPGSRMGATRLELAELSPDAAALLAADAWREAGGGSPPGWLTDSVGHRAGGHPLFVRTATTSLLEAWEPGSPPPEPSTTVADASLGGLLMERVDGMSTDLRELVAMLAVSGDPCSPAVLSRIAEQVGGDRELARLIGQLADAGLVLVQSEGDGSVRLSHDVLRQTVYDSLSHAQRERLHRRFVEALAEAESSPVDIAHHVEMITDPDLTRRWLPPAATAARRAWNLGETVRFLERVHPILERAEQRRTEVELLEALLVAGRAGDLLERASTMAALNASRQTDAEQDAEDRLQEARRSLAIATAALACGRFAEGVVAAQEAMRRSDGVDELAFQRAAQQLVHLHSQRGQASEALAIAQDLLPRAVDHGHVHTAATAQATLGLALFWAGRPGAAAAHYEAALSGAREAGDAILEIHVLSDLAGCCFETGRQEACLELLSQARTSADRIGYRTHLAFNLGNEALLRSARGDPFATACAAAAVNRSLEIGDLVATADFLHAWLTADPELSTTLLWWKRLRNIEARLGRSAWVARHSACMALMAARAGQTTTAGEEADYAENAARTEDLPDVRHRVALARALAERYSLPSTSDAGADAFLSSLDRILGGHDLSPVHRAEIALERWRVTQTEADHARALELATRAFEDHGSVTLRAWFLELDAQPPAASSPLPPPVGIAASLPSQEALDRAMMRIEGILGAATVSTSSGESPFDG